jgi:hypothetical protein
MLAATGCYSEYFLKINTNSIFTYPLQVKQPFKALILIVIITISLVQCGKHATVIDPNFIGIWNGSDGVSTYVLSIDNGSNGYWHRNNNGVFETAQGVARIRSGKLHIGLKSFDIVQYPTEDTAGVWSMNLSGIVYSKQ